MKILARIIILTITISCILMLSGCSTKTPVEQIVSDAVQNVDEMLDYAEGNIVENSDTMFLMSGLKACRSDLISCESAYHAEIAAEKNKTSLWQVVSAALVAAIGTLLYLLFKRK